MTKCCNYVCKPEQKSKSLCDIERARFVAGEPGAQPHAQFQSILFNVLKRDFPGQEVGAINLGLPGVVTTYTSPRCCWDGETREISPDNSTAGKINTHWNAREQYLHRIDIMRAHRPKLIDQKQVVHDATAAHVAGLSFLEFYTCYNVRFNSASHLNPVGGQQKRFTILQNDDPRRVVPLMTPDLPITMRDPKHPKHELYCEYRLFTLRPFSSEADWAEFKVKAAAVRDASPLNGVFGMYHLAYFAFIEAFEAAAYADGGKGCTTHTARLIKQDGDSINSAVDGDDGTLSEATTLAAGEKEAWMKSMQLHAQSLDDASALKVTEMPQNYWDGVYDKYKSLDGALESDNWITRMATTPEIGIISEEAQARVDVSRLNAEQKYVADKLLLHHRATQLAERTCGIAPPPLCMVVYGLGGTGKSHVLRAFAQGIDDDARAERERLAALAALGGGAAAPLPMTKFSADVVCIMSVMAKAAALVGGDTVHACLKFPFSFNLCLLRIGALVAFGFFLGSARSTAARPVHARPRLVAVAGFVLVSAAR